MNFSVTKQVLNQNYMEATYNEGSDGKATETELDHLLNNTSSQLNNTNKFVFVDEPMIDISQIQSANNVFEGNDEPMLDISAVNKPSEMIWTSPLDMSNSSENPLDVKQDSVVDELNVNETLDLLWNSLVDTSNTAESDGKYKELHYKYKCKMCPERFQTKRKLHCHMTVPTKCKKCHMFFRGCQIDAHTRTCNVQSQETNPVAFETPSHLGTHNSFQSQEIVYFDKEQLLKKQNREHTRHKCDNCFKLFRGCHFKAHVRNCGSKVQTATSDNVHVVQQNELNQNVKQEVQKVQQKEQIKYSESIEFPCSDCDMQFHTEAALEVHVKNKHIVQGQCFSCPICHIKVKRESAFRCHLKNHADDDSDLVGISNVSSEMVVNLIDTNTMQIGNVPKLQDIQQNSQNTRSKAKLKTKIDNERLNITDNPEELKFRCRHCGKRFQNALLLNSHKMEGHFDYTYESKWSSKQHHQCRFCNKVYKDGWHLKNHFRMQHSDRRDFVCDKCNQTYKTKCQVQDHAKRLHGKGHSYSCTKCKKDIIFRSRTHFDNHLDLHQSKNAHILLRMSSKSGNGTDTRLKKPQQHPQEMNNLNNIRISAVNEQLEENKIVNKNPVNFIHCNKINVTVSSVAVKSTEVERNIKPKYECSDCPRRFETKCSLSRHKGKVHVDSLTYKTKPRAKLHRCHVCQKPFRDTWHLKEHFLVNHSQRRDFVCQECNQTYKTKGQIQDHTKRLHADGDPYPCPKCKKDIIFRNKTLFENHLDLHRSKSAHILFRLPSKSENKTDTTFKTPQHNLQEVDKNNCDSLMNEYLEEENKVVNPIKIFKSDDMDQVAVKTLDNPIKVEGKYDCLKCQLRFRTMNQLDDHYGHVHMGIADTKSEYGPCTKCFQYFAGSNALREHIKVCHSQGIDVKCKNEDYMVYPEKKSIVKSQQNQQKANKTNSMGKIRSKIDNKTVKPKKYKCHCGKQYKTSAGLQAHKATVHTWKRAFRCQDCNQSYNTQICLEKHTMDNHQQGEKYYCEFCKKKIIFSTENFFKQHLHNHKRQQKREAEQSQQKREYGNRIREHTRSNSKVLPIVKEEPTTMTNDTFKEMDDIESNQLEDGFEIEIDNGEDDVELWSCSVCYMEFVCEENLRKHPCLQAHRNPACQCQICGKQCQSDYELQEHEETYHAYDKKYHFPMYKKEMIICKPDLYDEHISISKQKKEVNHTNRSDYMTPDCSSTTMVPDYNTTSITSDYDGTSIAPDCSLTRIAPDCSVTKIAPDCSLTKIAPDCSLTKIAPDCSVTSMEPDLRVIRMAPDCNVTRMTPDCSATSLDFARKQLTLNKEKASRKSQSWTCSRCSVEFDSVKDLITHKCSNKNCPNNSNVTNDQERQSWKCLKCTHEFGSVKDLMEHARTHR